MTAKKKLRAKVKKLKSKVKKLKRKVARADGNTARWEQKATQNNATIASLQERVAKRDKQLSKAKRTARHLEPLREDAGLSGEDVPELAEVAPPTKAEDARIVVVTGEPAHEPDETWTVVRLRAEARSRGITGLSGKTKAELLAALT